MAGNFAQREISRKREFRTMNVPPDGDARERGHMPKRKSMPAHDTHKFLRAWRKSKNLRLRELAEALNVGVSTISGWETGERQVDLADLTRLAEAYGVHPAALLLSPEEGNPTVDHMREASSLAKDMEDSARAEWLALGRRLVRRSDSD